MEWSKFLSQAAKTLQDQSALPASFFAIPFLPFYSLLQWKVEERNRRKNKLSTTVVLLRQTVLPYTSTQGSYCPPGWTALALFVCLTASTWCFRLSSGDFSSRLGSALLWAPVPHLCCYLLHIANHLPPVVNQRVFGGRNHVLFLPEPQCLPHLVPPPVAAQRTFFEWFMVYSTVPCCWCTENTEKGILSVGTEGADGDR